jgi:tetratricopeptide (TPR) repeat protein
MKHSLPRSSSARRSAVMYRRRRESPGDGVGLSLDLATAAPLLYAEVVRRPCRVVALVGLLQLCGAVARADDPREESRAHYQIGRIEYGKGHVREALAEFRKAYEAAPIPDLLYNIGRCLEELGDRGAAATSYERYLAAKPDAPERDELEAHIGELRRAPAVTVGPAPLAASVRQTLPPERPPVYRRWWFWTGIAAVVAVGVGVGVGVGSSSSPALSFPGVTAR